MRIAVIGAGISGLSAAWLLSGEHDVVLFEREARFGGHSNTVEVGQGARKFQAVRAIPIDTGFIVYNTACYPNLIALYKHLDVPTCPTDMGFAVSLDGGHYEYNGSGLNGFFAQRANALSPRHWRMALEIGRFFKEAAALQAQAADFEMTLGQWLSQRNF